MFSDRRWNSYGHVPHQAVSVPDRWSCKMEMDLNFPQAREGCVVQVGLFSSRGNSVFGAWKQAPSHCSGDTPVHHPLTCSSTGEPAPPELHTQRARQPPAASLTGFQTRGCRFSVDFPRSCTRTQVPESLFLLRNENAVPLPLQGRLSVAARDQPVPVPWKYCSL